MTANTAAAGSRITAAWLNTNIPGPWTAITPMSSWANAGGGAATFQCRLYNSVTVEVIGVLTIGTSANGAQIGQLPSWAYPASSQSLQATCSTSASATDGTSCAINVLTSGALKVWGMISGAIDLNIHIWISLDA